jgi:predicted nucleic acid-binding protein
MASSTKKIEELAQIFQDNMRYVRLTNNDIVQAERWGFVLYRFVLIVKYS